MGIFPSPGLVQLESEFSQLLGISPFDYLQQFIGFHNSYNDIQGVATSPSMGRTYDYDVRGSGAVWASEGIGNSQGLGLYNRDTASDRLGFSEGY